MNLLLGYGEIGKAFGALMDVNKVSYKYIDLLESSDDLDTHEYEFMLVNIPYNEKFIETVLTNIKTYNPKYVIINSTVPVGTTENINTNSTAMVVHSPVRGIHPRLAKSLEVFVKQIGVDFPVKEAKPFVEFFNELGIMRCEVIRDSKNTELAKLLSTTCYGVQIAWATAVKEMCDFYNCDFHEVYTKSNIIYNDGYKILKMPNYKRPILYPNEGGLGGHCVYNNAKLVPKQGKMETFIQQILDLGVRKNE